MADVIVTSDIFDDFKMAKKCSIVVVDCKIPHLNIWYRVSQMASDNDLDDPIIFKLITARALINIAKKLESNNL